MAHTAGAALRLGVDEQKMEAVWEYRSSPLFSEAERVALDLALAAASQPNDVTDELMDRAFKHWSENQIVEIVGCVAMFGFLNRWNDSMATPLEEEPVEVGEKHLAKLGWEIGKHGDGRHGS
jgi:alkylhydroperoxidase family enzyme